MDEYVELHLPIVLEFPVAWKLSQAWFLQPLEGEFQVSDFTGLLCLRLFTAWVRALWPAHVVGVPLCILFRWLTFLSYSSGSFLTCLTTIRPRGLLVSRCLLSFSLPNSNFSCWAFAVASKAFAAIEEQKLLALADFSDSSLLWPSSDVGGPCWILGHLEGSLACCIAIQDTRRSCLVFLQLLS